MFFSRVLWIFFSGANIFFFDGPACVFSDVFLLALPPCELRWLQRGNLCVFKFSLAKLSLQHFKAIHIFDHTL